VSVSQKQLEANRKNAKKGGVKTGKAVIKYNALKHGLLAKETVITAGEGAEDPEEFNSLLEDLKKQLAPVGCIEEILVEKVAVAYWRLRRAYRFEVGLIRQELDTVTDDYYRRKGGEGNSTNKPEDKIKEQIYYEKIAIKDWKECKADLQRMYEQGKPLEEAYDRDDSWASLDYEVSRYSSYEKSDIEEGDDGFVLAAKLNYFLSNQMGWSDKLIWEKLIGVCDEEIKEHKSAIASFEKERERIKLRLQVLKKLGNIPSRLELDRLLRYEASIERRFYKALNELERLQRMRLGEKVPAPLEVEFSSIKSE
jgi:hypothetical protein